MGSTTRCQWSVTVVTSVKTELHTIASKQAVTQNEPWFKDVPLVWAAKQGHINCIQLLILGPGALKLDFVPKSRFAVQESSKMLLHDTWMVLGDPY